MWKYYMTVILVLIISMGCTTDKDNETSTTNKKSVKSYAPKEVVDTADGEFLPVEKSQTTTNTPEPVANPTFRKVKWGMSKQDVKSRETGTVTSESDNVIIYEGISVAGLNTYVGYVFVEDKLYRGVYMFNENYVNDDRYLTDYSSLKEILTSKYGNPEEDKKTWLTDSDYYRKRPGDAVRMGELILYSIWTTDDSKIVSFPFK